MALMDLFQRAVEQAPFNGVRRTKFGILRNTLAQLKTTIKPLIDMWFVELTGNRMGQWRLSDNTFEARFRLPDGTVVHSEFIMLVADTPDDVRRLLSLELSSAWVEECREVDDAVFSGLQGRVNRFPARIAGGVTRAGVVGSTNPPRLGTTWHKMMTEPSKGVDVFIQPPALLDSGVLNPERENADNLAPDYYDNLTTGKSQDWIDVYLKNQFGAGDWGMPVFRKTFRRAFHTTKTPIAPLMQSLHPLVVGLDNGLQAAAVIGQRDMTGRVNVLAESYVPEDTTMGVDTFMRTQLLPLLSSKFPTFRRENIIFVADPACFQRTQWDAKTIAQGVQSHGFQVVKAATNDVERRIQAVESLLALQIDGGAGLLVSPDCHYITEALDWGYRYCRQVAQRTSTTPDKTHHSHIADALQYLCLHYDVSAPAGSSQLRARTVVAKPYIYA
jgi:hypothetical protein